MATIDLAMLRREVRALDYVRGSPAEDALFDMMNGCSLPSPRNSFSSYSAIPMPVRRWRSRRRVRTASAGADRPTLGATDRFHRADGENSWLKGIFGYGEIATDVPFLLTCLVLLSIWKLNRRDGSRNTLMGSASFGDRRDLAKLEGSSDLVTG